MSWFGKHHLTYLATLQTKQLIDYDKKIYVSSWRMETSIVQYLTDAVSTCGISKDHVLSCPCIDSLNDPQMGSGLPYVFVNAVYQFENLWLLLFVDSSLPWSSELF